MLAHLSPICSSILVFITVVKLMIAVWRLCLEWTDANVLTATPLIREPKLLLEIGVSTILFILGGLILAFSFVTSEKQILQILLSLIGSLLIGYQVAYLILYYADWERWLWCGFLLCFTVTLALSILVAVCSQAEALQTIILSFIAAEYSILLTAFLTLFWEENLEGLVSDVIWSCLIWVGVCLSLVLYLVHEVDFITSLWINTAAALVWFVWMLYIQAAELRVKFRPPGERGNQGGLGEVIQGSCNEELNASAHDLERQNSTGPLMVPRVSAVGGWGRV